MGFESSCGRGNMRFLGFGLCLILLACGSEDGRLKGNGGTQVMAKPALAGLYLDELSAAQWQETCEWMVEVQGGSRTVDCQDGMMATVESVSTCEKRRFRPHCPASSLIACLEIRGEAVCGEEPPECIRYYDCVRSSRPVVTALHTNL